MITEFGKLLRKLRIDQGEVLKDMADKLNVSSAYLSAIEVGKRAIPETMIMSLENIYGFGEEMINELKDAADQSIKNIKINLDDTVQIKRNAALVFARNSETMDQDTAKKILGFFERSDH